MRTPVRMLLGLVAVGAVATSLAACSSDGGSSGSTGSAGGGSSSAAADPSKPLADIADLSGGKMTQVTLDSGFVNALTTLKLTPGVIGTAKLDAGVLTFPITGGNVKYYNPTGPVQPFVQGKIDHDGSGLSLTAGSIKVSLENFVVDPGADTISGQVSVNGKVAVPSAVLFDLDGTTLKALQTSGSDAILEGTKVEVSDAAAKLLNSTFKTDAVKGGLLVGIAKITVAVPASN